MELTGKEFHLAGGFGTHQPLLLHALEITRGPVLEIGCGYYSTPMLHHLCRAQRRNLVTLDSQKEWMQRFLCLECGVPTLHAFHYVPDFMEQLLTPWWADKSWGWSVALIDNHPEASRKHLIEKLKDRAEVLVIHDTEEAGYELETVLPSFKYRFDYKELFPWTSAVSDVLDPTMV